MSCRSGINHTIRVLPWGEEIYLEIPLHEPNSVHKFYARHGKTADGREFIEFSKFGAVENTESETYSQKLRFFNQDDWNKFLRGSQDVFRSIGWEQL